MIDSEHSLYELLGGEAGVRKLVDRFYDLMDSTPEAAQIRSIHPKSLRERFLSQFVANFSMRRMLAIYTTDSLDETVCSKSRDRRR